MNSESSQRKPELHTKILTTGCHSATILCEDCIVFVRLQQFPPGTPVTTTNIQLGELAFVNYP